MPPTTISPEPTSSGQPHPHWFAGEVRAHDASLRSYLRGSFPAVRDADDVLQESYLRLWKECARQPIRSAKAFLFTIARRLALDQVRRHRNSPLAPMVHVDEMHAVADGADVVDEIGRRERLQLLAQAVAGLPPKCREVFLLYKVQGISRKEAAARLRISEKTVESHTAHAMRHCEAFLRRKDLKGVFRT